MRGPLLLRGGGSLSRRLSRTQHQQFNSATPPPPSPVTSQARYLADFPQHVTPAYAAVCLGVALTGFAVFRAANSQKDTFKKDPGHASVKGAWGRGVSVAHRDRSVVRRALCLYHLRTVSR